MDKVFQELERRIIACRKDQPQEFLAKPKTILSTPSDLAHALAMFQQTYQLGKDCSKRVWDAVRQLSTLDGGWDVGKLLCVAIMALRSSADEPQPLRAEKAMLLIERLPERASGLSPRQLSTYATTLYRACDILPSAESKGYASPQYLDNIFEKA